MNKQTADLVELALIKVLRKFLLDAIFLTINLKKTTTNVVFP